MAKEKKKSAPRCTVVIQKKLGGKGRRCNKPATDFIALTKPDSPELDSVIFLCPDHSKKLDEGKSLLADDNKGNHQLLKANIEK